MIQNEPSAARIAAAVSVAKQSAAEMLKHLRCKRCEGIDLSDVLLVNVRRQWNDYKIATYRLSDIDGLHWSDTSGGINKRAPREFLHGYVLCTGLLSGELAHSCRHGQGPHSIKVCITKTGNEKVWPFIIEKSPPR